jgi:hypothetical protein
VRRAAIIELDERLRKYISRMPAIACGAPERYCSAPDTFRLAVTTIR